MPFFDRIIAVSEHVRRGIIKRVGVDPVDVTTIVNGIDVTRFSGGGARTRCREEFGVPDGSRLIGVVARLTPEKDHATLLEAFAIVSAQRSDVVLAIVGDGPTLAEAKETARRLGIEGLVRFTGSRLDVPDILSAFDLFAMSSKEEGLGITLIEAMAAGLPVVATAAGGIPEIVQDGVTGFIVPPGDSQGLADALLRGLSDDARGREMGEAGRRRAVERFSLTRMIGDYEKVYAELAAR
jgi:glycosyltransferase involved in cell wall biosynthesis